MIISIFLEIMVINVLYVNCCTEVNTVLIILQDVKGSMTAAEISEQLDLTSIKQHPWHIQACCALTGEGYISVLNIF